MKFSKELLKIFSLVLAVLFIFQSCTVYHSVSVTLEEAIQSEERVKVITNTKEKYIFKRVEQEENQIIGIVSEKSDTAKKLSKVKDGRKYKGLYDIAVIVPNENIKGVYLKDKSLSIILSVAVPILSIIGLIGIAYETSSPYDWSGVGN